MVVWGAAELAARSSRLRTADRRRGGSAAGSLDRALPSFRSPPGRTAITVFRARDSKSTDDNYFAHNHLGLAYRRGRARTKPEEPKRAEEAAKLQQGGATLPQLRCGQREPRRVLMTMRKQFDKALAYFETAVRVNPFNAGHRCNLGLMYDERANSTSRRRVSGGSRDRSDDPDSSLETSGHRSVPSRKEVPRRSPSGRDARDCVRTTSSLLNESPGFWRPARTHRIRNGEEAVQLAQRAVELTGGRGPRYSRHLGRRLCRDGKFRLAVETASRAADLARLQQNRQDHAEMPSATASRLRGRQALLEKPAGRQKPARPAVINVRNDG